MGGAIASPECMSQPDRRRQFAQHTNLGKACAEVVDPDTGVLRLDAWGTRMA